MLTGEQAIALGEVLRAMKEAEEAIFNGTADQYHSDTLHDAQALLREKFGIISEPADDPDGPSRYMPD